MSQPGPSPAAEEAPRPTDSRRGAALILTLLTLAILVVLVVQFTFSMKVESNIVQNSTDDAALEFAARGALPIVVAMFKDDRLNGEPKGAVDTLGDLPFDPNSSKAREVKVGKVTLTLEVEDLERRFPLPWLAREDRKEWAEKVLERLIQRTAPEAQDATALAKAIAEKVRSLSAGTKAVAAPEGGGGEAPPAPEAGALRGFYALEQLIAPSAKPSEGEAAPAPPAEGEAPAAPAANGVDRKVLWGDPKAETPSTGIAPYVTAWDVPTLNVNTVSAEVLEAILPEENKNGEKLEGDTRQEVVNAIREHRIDPAHQQGKTSKTEGGEGGEAAPAPPAGEGSGGEGGGGEGGGKGASRTWSGEPFKKVEELAKAEIHQWLASLFKKTQGGGGSGGSGSGGSGSGSSGGGQSSSSGDTKEEFEFEKALDVRSRFYVVRITAQLEGGSRAVYRMVVHRNDQDEVSLLMFEEVPTTASAGESGSSDDSGMPAGAK